MMTEKDYNDFWKDMKERKIIKRNFEYLKGFEIGDVGHWGVLVALYELTPEYVEEHGLCFKFRCDWKHIDEEGKVYYNSHALSYCKAEVA